MSNPTAPELPELPHVPAVEAADAPKKVWVTPTFERLSLADAMAGIRNLGADLGCS